MLPSFWVASTKPEARACIAWRGTGNLGRLRGVERAKGNNETTSAHDPRPRRTRVPGGCERRLLGDGDARASACGNGRRRRVDGEADRPPAWTQPAAGRRRCAADSHDLERRDRRAEDVHGRAHRQAGCLRGGGRLPGGRYVALRGLRRLLELERGGGPVREDTRARVGSDRRRPSHERGRGLGRGRWRWDAALAHPRRRRGRARRAGGRRTPDPQAARSTRLRVVPLKGHKRQRASLRSRPAPASGRSAASPNATAQELAWTSEANTGGVAAAATESAVCWKPSAAPLRARPASSAAAVKESPFQESESAPAVTRAGTSRAKGAPLRAALRASAAASAKLRRSSGAIRAPIRSDQRPVATRSPAPSACIVASTPAAAAVESPLSPCRTRTAKARMLVCAPIRSELPTDSRQIRPSRSGWATSPSGSPSSGGASRSPAAPASAVRRQPPASTRMPARRPPAAATGGGESATAPPPP